MNSKEIPHLITYDGKGPAEKARILLDIIYAARDGNFDNFDEIEEYLVRQSDTNSRLTFIPNKNHE